MREVLNNLSHFSFFIGKNPQGGFLLFCVSKCFYFASCTRVQHARKKHFLQRFTIAVASIRLLVLQTLDIENDYKNSGDFIYLRCCFLIIFCLLFFRLFYLKR